MVQLLEIYHATQEGCIFLGTCILTSDELWVLCQVAGKGKTVIYFTFSHRKAMQERPMDLGSFVSFCYNLIEYLTLIKQKHFFIMDCYFNKAFPSLVYVRYID